MSSSEPPVVDDPEDGKPVDVYELKRLQRQAHEMGLHIYSDDPTEMEALLALAKKERGSDHPVPCFGLSHDPTDRRCRICQLRTRCAELDKSPRVEVGQNVQLQPVPCEVCGGSLEVEIETKDRTEVRDYGCTTMGCLNTLGVQCGWERHGGGAVRKVVLPKDKPAEEKKVDRAPEAPDTTEVSSLQHETHPTGESAVTLESESKPDPEPKPQRKKPKIVLVKPEPKPVKKKSVKKRPGPKKKITKKKATKKKAVKTKPGRPVFVYGGQTYKSLSAVSFEICQSKNWSGRRFFNVVGPIRAGTTLQREWQGQKYVVHVVEAD